MLRTALIAAALAVFALPASAQDYKTILDIPNGQSIVNLSASERVEVQQDLLVASLRYETENANAKILQDEINKIMGKALEKSKSFKDIKISTDQYYVYQYETPVPYKDGQPVAKPERVWRGSQGITIKSLKSDDVLELTGALQEMGLSMNNLSYVVSPELLETTQDSLMEAALAKVKAKAERTAKALGKGKADLVEINVDMGGNYYPQPMMRAMAMDGGARMEKASAPVAAPGQSEITLTVSARAILKP